jgi:hypothetical protein
MSRTIHEIDVQRARWWRYRTGQHLMLEAGEHFALGGLARYADDGAPRTRMEVAM